jgi:hypothetical protein
MKLDTEYLAGLIDAEGCIDVQFAYSKHYLNSAQRPISNRVRLAMADVALPLLQAIKDRFGGRLSHRKQEGNDQWSNSTSLAWVSSREVYPLLQAITPHLRVKKEQALISLWWMDNCKGIRESSYPGIGKARLYFVEELKAMKKDPGRKSSDAEFIMNQMVFGVDDKR